MKFSKKVLSILGITLAIAVLVVSGGMANAAEKKVRWKLAMTWGTNLVPFTDGVANMASMVETMSDGNFIIRIDSADKHKAPFGVLDMVKLGQYDMGHSASYYWKGKDIALLPLTTMPFDMTVPEQYSWFYHGGGLDLMQKAYAKHNVLSFPGGNTGVQMGGWFKKEINSLEDLKGLKMRIPGFAGEILANLGLTVTNIPVGELYMALERGTIDALEWVGPGMDIKMGFHKIAPYYYTGWHEPGGELQFLVNKKKFNTLSDKNKKILTVAMKLTAYDIYIKNYHMSTEAWSQIEKDFPKIKIRTLPKEVMDALKAENKRLQAEKTKTNPMLKEILDSRQTYMKKAREWTRISAYSYLRDNL